MNLLHTGSCRGKKTGQVAIEYMLLLGVVVAIVLVGFNKYLPRIFNAANAYYDVSTNAIVGKANRCGDRVCGLFENCEKCLVDCGTCP